MVSYYAIPNWGVNIPRYKLDDNIGGKVVKEALNSGIPRDAIKLHTFGGIEVDSKYHEKFWKNNRKA